MTIIIPEELILFLTFLVIVLTLMRWVRYLILKKPKPHKSEIGRCNHLSRIGGPLGPTLRCSRPHNWNEDKCTFCPDYNKEDYEIPGGID